MGAQPLELILAPGKVEPLLAYCGPKGTGKGDSEVMLSFWGI